MLGKKLRYTTVAILVLLACIQLYQPERTNPPVNPEATFEAVAKPAPEVAAIVNRACRDCHTNRTEWPLYSRISPVSWLVAQDVREGRSHLNFSEWSYLSSEMSAEKLRRICSEVREVDMPLWQYRLMHPKARLSREDIEILCKASSTAAGAK